jgi:hypothetical protein
VQVLRVLQVAVFLSSDASKKVYCPPSTAVKHQQFQGAVVLLAHAPDYYLGTSLQMLYYSYYLYYSSDLLAIVAHFS